MILMFDRNFVFGVITGVVGVYVYHRYVRPMPSKASG
jgi:hypothetical protein